MSLPVQKQPDFSSSFLFHAEISALTIFALICWQASKLPPFFSFLIIVSFSFNKKEKALLLNRWAQPNRTRLIYSQTILSDKKSYFNIARTRLEVAFYFNSGPEKSWHHFQIEN